MGLRSGQTRLMFFPSSIIHQTPKAVNLSYEEVWIPMDNGKLNGWWIAGNCANCPTILYFHGNSSNLGDLLDKALFFDRLGVSILLIDYRGYGKSQGKFPDEIQLYEDAEASWLYLTQKQQIAPIILLYTVILWGVQLPLN
ncbi:MAG: hypothetical protein F6K54_31325 [Okeania sp. SIO3B5]|uniref:alpha/beta hydrolase n=1 Tax=Okeania sp. SIO3B5 TaxID=2607811 RepID=UPI001401745C|nr:hypothetical protein [Okeania sp. SIO3B5]NEO57169.1 hypothetical protein [Okeania sp. SIO3B5]